MTKEDKELKARREAHIEALREMHDMMLESENWEHMKRLIDAVTAGAFAIARLNKIDFGEKPKTGVWHGGELGYADCCGHKGCASDIWTGCGDDCYCPHCGAKIVEFRHDES